ncbi:MAG: DUF4040 domain-containing protein [Kangiellaceae bacterium]|nr:DUF4040 domain-containing protein [Kangiellaceae bacterium]
MIIIFAVFLLSLLVITAIAIVRAKNLFVAVMLTAIFSLLMAANFFILDAADVALTEAAIGAGVTTVIFLGALSLTAENEKKVEVSRGLAMCVVAATTLVLIYATFDKPKLGDPEAPVHQHVAPWYLAETPNLIGIPNVVTAVLGSFRAYDTLGEVFVVFIACIGVLFLLSARNESDLRSHRTPPESIGLRHHLIPKVVGRLLFPFIILFGLYVQFHGEYGPGGGFQAGAIIATGIILFALLEGEKRALAAVPHSVMMGMIAGGAMLYTLVGVTSMFMGGNFLDYSVLSSDPVFGQQLGNLLIEAGVGITVCGALLTIFHAFAARENY